MLSLPATPQVTGDMAVRCCRDVTHSSRFRFSTLLCVGGLCVGAWLFSPPLIAASQPSDLENLQQSITEKEKSIQQQQQQRVALQQKLQQQEKIISQTSQQLRDTQNRLTSLNGDVAHLGSSIQKLQKQQASQQVLLAKQLDAAFRQGQHNSWQWLLNSEGSQRSERIMAYFAYLNQSREQSIKALQETHDALISQRKSLVNKQQQQKILLSEGQTQQKTLEQARSNRKKTLTTLESSLEKDQQRLIELRQNEAHLRDEIAQAEQAARAKAEKEAREAAKVREQVKTKQQQAEKSGSSYKPSESEHTLMTRTGGLGTPSGQALWPVQGRIEHRFGEALQGELRWKGIVISAPEGSEVKAIADGRVLLADWLQGYGLVVVISHGKGDMSLYGYNQSALVKVGAQVEAGQPIALVGTSGGQNDPSLYFEIRRQGQAMNPQPWLGH